jgi:hypothetical protein
LDSWGSSRKIWKLNAQGLMAFAAFDFLTFPYRGYAVDGIASGARRVKLVSHGPFKRLAKCYTHWGKLMEL